MEKAMTLYILKTLHTGRVKIGISGDFAQRLDAIRRSNSEDIEVLRAYQDNDGDYIRQLEKDLHKELNAVRWQYEWFYPGAEVDVVIARLDRQFFPERFAPEPPVQVQA
jgi:T5orf172 domain